MIFALKNELSIASYNCLCSDHLCGFYDVVITLVACVLSAVIDVDSYIQMMDAV